MSDGTKIEWTDATWNPIVGCSVVSPGCTNCYAMRLAGTRMRSHPSRAGLTKDSKAGSVWTGEVRFMEQWLAQPLQWRKPRRIFVCAHADLFHEAVPDEWIDRVFAVMALAPQHTFQVLTKRPKRMREYLTRPVQGAWAGRAHRVLDDGRMVDATDVWMRMGRELCAILPKTPARQLNLASKIQEPHGDGFMPRWPLPNVWLGVSVEDQRRADERVDILRETPAAVRWVSAEPLLGRIEFDIDQLQAIDWVVAGGESGPNARPMHPDWARSLRDQCAAVGVPFLFKQWGEFGTAFFLTTTGQPTFRRFETFEQWTNKAQWARQGICLDALGRRCSIGSDFMRARDEGAFPVTIMHQIGKKAAGRLLDGVLHDAYPEAAR